jgi:hypothetical protein
LAISAGYRIANARLERRLPTLLQRAAFAAAYLLVLRNIRVMLGLDRGRADIARSGPLVLGARLKHV